MKLDRESIRHVSDPCPPEQAFQFADGNRADSLEAFHVVLTHVPGHVLDYHRTHLGPWIRDVLGDEPLAERVGAHGQSDADPERLRLVLRDIVADRLEELGRKTVRVSPQQEKSSTRVEGGSRGERKPPGKPKEASERTANPPPAAKGGAKSSKQGTKKPRK